METHAALVLGDEARHFLFRFIINMELACGRIVHAVMSALKKSDLPTWKFNMLFFILFYFLYIAFFFVTLISVVAPLRGH